MNKKFKTWGTGELLVMYEALTINLKNDINNKIFKSILLGIKKEIKRRTSNLSTYLA
jgi:hypothetical protein